jgi:hypothetical protein
MQAEILIRNVELSSHNCKLKSKLDSITGKEILSNHPNDHLTRGPISFRAEYFTKNLLPKIPKVQNMLYATGVRIRGLSMKRVFEL